MLTGLRERELDSSRLFARESVNRRTRSLEISRTSAISSAHSGGLTCLSLELAESRYLLAAATDSTVAIYDTAHATLDPKKNGCICAVDRNAPGGHRFSVSSVVWYPVDHGLFVTGSYDTDVKVWDANALQAACCFTLPAAVNAVAMSSCAVGHCLIAAASAGPEIHLCDPNSGSLSHTLRGHRDRVWATAWSLESEWELVTGGCDGQVRLWDIRTAGAVRLFDQHAAQPEQRRLKKRSKKQADHAAATALVASTAHEGSVTAVLPTQDGLHWVTAGTDSRVRLWDSQTLRNKLVNFRQTANRASKARQLAIAAEANILFHPSGSIVQGFDLLTGQQEMTLKGHMDAVNACCFNEVKQELYTGSNDQQICIWSYPVHDPDLEPDRDNWSP